MRKTNFKEDHYNDPWEAIIRRDVARNRARHLLALSIKEYSQWFTGHYETVSNTLSHDYNCENEELTHVLKFVSLHIFWKTPKFVLCPVQSSSGWPRCFRGCPLGEQLQEKHMKTKLGHGPDGSNGIDLFESSMMLFLMVSMETNKSDSSTPLPWFSMIGDFWDRLMTPWLRAQSKIPFHMWCWPSENMTGWIQLERGIASSADFYHAGFKHLKMTT